MSEMVIEVTSEDEMKAFGEQLGSLLMGGEVIEMVGDVGAGKTTLTKGVAAGLGVEDDVQSPSFTISRVYDGRNSLHLVHYDFYRLHDAGIMAEELRETVHDPQTVTILEWADVVEGVLPEKRLTVRITSPTETTRQLALSGDNELLEKL